MKTLCRSSLFIVLLAGWFSTTVEAQTPTVITDTDAVQHVGQQAAVEGTVVKVFTSKNGNTFLNFGKAYPNQTFTGWIPKGFASGRRDELIRPRGKKNQNHRNNNAVQGQA